MAWAVWVVAVWVVVVAWAVWAVAWAVNRSPRYTARHLRGCVNTPSMWCTLPYDEMGDSVPHLFFYSTTRPASSRLSDQRNHTAKPQLLDNTGDRYKARHEYPPLPCHHR